MNDETKQEDGTEANNAKQWMQDNLRIIISVIIVVLIAGGIYSYSKRTAPTITEQTGPEAVTAENDTSAISNQTTRDKSRVTQPVPTGTSQETANSFIESAGKGDSMTVLARKALANYLEKNPDSTLTPEHKIYIEDFLRKNVPKKRIFVGTSVEFSKDLVQNAMTKAKTLNDAQLKNLHKYAVRVPSLS